MTNEQAAEQYANKEALATTDELWGYKDVIAAFLAGIEYAEGNRWMRVDERLPEPNKHVMMWNDHVKDYRTGFMTGSGFFYSVKGMVSTAQNPTHWFYINPPINATTAPTVQDNEKDGK